MTSSYRMSVSQEKSGVLFRLTDSKDLLALVEASSSSVPIDISSAPACAAATTYGCRACQ